MLARQWRLRKNAEVLRVLKTGRKLRVGHLLVFFLPADQDQPRLAAVVSKKVSKKAVVRNHIRRVISELARPVFLEWGNRPKGDMVVMVMSQPTDDLFASLQHDLTACLNKLS